MATAVTPVLKADGDLHPPVASNRIQAVELYDSLGNAIDNPTPTLANILDSSQLLAELLLEMRAMRTGIEMIVNLLGEEDTELLDDSSTETE